MDRYTGEKEKGQTRSDAYGSYSLTSHTAHIQTALFGSTFGGQSDVNWSLAGLQKSGDEKKGENLALMERLTKVARAYDLNTLWAPNPTRFNGLITDRRALTERMPLTERINLYRGEYADGIELRKGEALILSSGGCPMLTIMHNYRVVAAHAGLKCLFDIDNPERASVVDHALRRLDHQGNRTKDFVKVRIDFALHPKVYDHPWDHPEWGSKNEKLCRTLMHRWGSAVLVGDHRLGRIDLIALVKQQLQPYRGVVISDDCRHLEPVRRDDVGDVRYYHTRMRAPHNTMRNLTMTARIQ